MRLVDEPSEGYIDIGKYQPSAECDLSMSLSVQWLTRVFRTQLVLNWRRPHGQNSQCQPSATLR